jgi:hypothetical protein
VSYWRWFHISIQMDHSLVVAVTNDGTNWVTVEQVVRSAQAWADAQWRVSDYVMPTATVQVRFTVWDHDPGSLMEALVDDFSVSKLTCESQARGDLNCDGVLNLDDVPHFVQALIDPAGYEADHDGSPYAACERVRADMNDDTSEDGLDIPAFVDALLGSP